MSAPADPMADKAAAVARKLYDHLLSLDLKRAEEAVEDARKITWACHFGGAPLAAVEDCYAPSPQATALAAGLAGHTLLEVEAILQELRFALYVNAYGALENTRFGALMRAALKADEEKRAGRPQQ